jgi:hypothetical protein
MSLGADLDLYALYQYTVMEMELMITNRKFEKIRQD